MNATLNEDGYEYQCIDWLKGIDWDWKYGPDIAPEGIAPERSSYKEVILGERLEDAISRINPGLPKDTIRSVHQLLASPGETFIESQRDHSRMVRERYPSASTWR